jgi:predicted nucleic acid-binding protein
MGIYLDTCCWNRPGDDHRQAAIRDEAAAILKITALSRMYGYAIYSSKALDEEINANPDAEKRTTAWNLYRRMAKVRAKYNENIFNHFLPIARQEGIRGYDALHLCYSIAAGANNLLTTDMQFLKVASRLVLPVLVINPLQFNVGGVI